MTIICSTISQPAFFVISIILGEFSYCEWGLKRSVFDTWVSPKKHKYQCTSKTLRVCIRSMLFVGTVFGRSTSRFRLLNNGNAAVQTPNCQTRERPGWYPVYSMGTKAILVSERQCLSPLRGFQNGTYRKPGAKAAGLNAATPSGLFTMKMHTRGLSIVSRSIVIFL